MDTPYEPGLTMLIVEPQSLLRRTLVSVARELRLATIHEASSVAAAGRMLAQHRLDAVFIALDEDGEAFELLARLRSGQSRSERDVAVAVFASDCSAATAVRLKQLGVRRMLLKPYKIKSVLETIAGLWPAHSAALAA
jgi:DNA-binding NarL/FixJ family response regulator